MKRSVLFTAILALFFTTFASAAAVAQLKTSQDRMSYALGMEIATGLKSQGIILSPEIAAMAMQNVFDNQKTLLSQQDMRTELQNMQKQLMAKMAKKQKVSATSNASAGEQFLAANAKKADVTTLASGLQYKVIKTGSGAKPMASDSVNVNYVGKTIDGKIFDQGKGVKFNLSKVIPGFTQALTMMPEGSKWEIFLPSTLAYGDKAVSPLIGPNATLTFEIELLNINKS